MRDFQLLATLVVDGPVLAQPLFVQSVNFRGTRRSMVWIATAKNNIYAFHADPPFEQLSDVIHLGAPYEPNRADLALVGASLLTCLREDPACQHPIIGIESTPVIDRDSGTMFVGYRRNTRLAGEQRLAAIDIRTGQKRSDVAVPGSDIWHKLHRNRASLLLDHKVVFLAFSAINEGKREGDYRKSYQGWVHAFDADTLFHLGSYRTIRDPGNHGNPLDPSDDALDGGGLWQGSTGLAADGKGNVFFAAGNGAKHPSAPDANNLSNSVVRLAIARSKVRAPVAGGNPATMVTAGQQHIFYRGTDNAIHHIFWDSHHPPGQLFHDNWTALAQAPSAAGDSATMVTTDQQHIFYRGTDNAIHHIFWDSHSPPGRLFHDNWTALAQAPSAAGAPATMVTTGQQHVFYRGADNAIHHIFWDSHSPPGRLFHDNWTTLAQAPRAAGDPATMVTTGQQHIFYRTADGSTQHVFWDSHNPPGHLNADSWTVLPDRVTMTPADWFTPYRTIWQDNRDMDLGSSGVMLIPGTTYMVAGGKEGILYLLHQNNLGKFDGQPVVGDCPLPPSELQDAPTRDHVVQKFRVGINQYFAAEQRPLPVCDHFDWMHWPHIHGTPVFGDLGGGQAFLYIWPEKDFLKSFRWSGSRFQTRPITTTALGPPWKDVRSGPPFGQNGMPGGMLSLNIDPTRAGAGVLFASSRTCSDGTAWHECSPALCGTAENLNSCVNQDIGILRAFDPVSLRELWNNQVNTNASAADKRYRFVKFVPPSVANGRVFLVTFDNKVLVYGRPH